MGQVGLVKTKHSNYCWNLIKNFIFKFLLKKLSVFLTLYGLNAKWQYRRYNLRDLVLDVVHLVKVASPTILGFPTLTLLADCSTNRSLQQKSIKVDRAVEWVQSVNDFEFTRSGLFRSIAIGDTHKNKKTSTKMATNTISNRKQQK